MSLPLRNIAANMERFTAVVIGPGLGKAASNLKQAKTIFDLALKQGQTLVVDADALPLLLGKHTNKGHIKRLRSTIIATPHPKEAGGLLRENTETIQADRQRSASKLVSLPINEVADVIWVLKGIHPIVAQKGTALQILEGGVPALSVAGSGDVLSGTIAAVVAQTRTPFDACLVGVSAHLSAGRALRGRGHFATEIADALGHVLWQ
jgi:NAD(P)H-hydrate repair Nnr-like enzyme with NAD(P)H-hydrate dehydratase domain